MNELRCRRRVGENSRQLSETAMSKMKMELKEKKRDEVGRRSDERISDVASLEAGNSLEMSGRLNSRMVLS